TVSTSVGIEGLGLTPGEHVRVADDAEGLADAVSELLLDERASERLAAKGRPAVLEGHSRAAARDAFIASLEEVLGVDPKRKKAPEDDRELFGERMVYQETQRLRDALCEALHKVVPDGAVLAVATGGSAELLRLDTFTAWPYPSRDVNGSEPASEEDMEEARRDLEALIAHGAEFLVIPAPSVGWLQDRPLLRQHLEATYRIVLNDDTLGIAYSLSPVAIP